MKRVLVNLSIFLAAFFCSTNYANSPELLFKVTSNGTTLNINTVKPNHTYPQAGIKITAPGYTLKNAGTECKPNANGYCLFPASDKVPTTISINGPTGTMSAVLCLNGLGPLSCQNYTNISITSTPIPPPLLPRFAYVVNGDGTNYSVLVCPFAPDRVTLLGCQDTNLDTATYPNFTYPQGISFNNDGSRAYVTTYDNSLTPPTAAWECVVNSSDGTFSACSPYAVTAPGTFTFPAYGMIALNNTNTTAYIVDWATPDVILCPIGANGAFSSTICTSSLATTLSSPIGIAVNSASTTAYIANSGGGVSVCTISGSSFTNCINKTGDGDTTFNFVYGVALNYAETFVYITEPYSNNVYACSTSPNNTSTFSTCFNANGSNVFNTPYGIVLNRAGTMAYITSYFGPGNIYECPINIDGSFDTCVPFNPAAVFMYSPDITLVY